MSFNTASKEKRLSTRMRLPRLGREKRQLESRDMVTRSTSAMQFLRHTDLGRVEQASPTSLDVWPANNNNGKLKARQLHLLEGDDFGTDNTSSLAISKPKLCNELEALISTGLTAVSHQFPQFKDINTFHVDKKASISTGDVSWVADSQETDGLKIDGGMEFDLSSMAQECASAAHGVIQSGEDRFALARLEVFRQAAQAFASSFKTYSPILQCIVEEYEGFVSFWMRFVNEERHLLREKEQEAYRMSDDLRKREANAIALIKELEVELAAKDERNKELQQTIDDMKENYVNMERISRECDFVTKTLEDEKAVLARHILKLEADIVQLNKKLETPEKVIASLRAQLDNKDDAIKKLKELQERTLGENTTQKRQIITLKQRTQARNNANAEMELMQCIKREQTHQVLIARLQGRVGTVNNQIKLMAQSTPFQHTGLSGGKGSALTPRPTVTHPMLDQVPGTGGKLQEAIRIIDQLRTDLEGSRKTIAELQCVLPLREPVQLGMRAALADHVVEQGKRWFACLGDGEEVPLLLRGIGRARNHKFSREAIKLHIRDFFAARSAQLAEHDPDVAGLFADWMFGRYAQEALNMNYSFYKALSWFPYDVDCSLFKMLLDETASMRTWTHGYAVSEELRTHLAEWVLELGVAKVSKFQMTATIARYFSTWEDEWVGYLIQTITNFFTGDALDPSHLFYGADNSESALVTAIRGVDVIAQKSFFNDLEAAVLEDTAIVSGEVSCQMLAEALRSIDPDRPIEMVDEFITSVFGEKSVDGFVDTADLEIQFKDRYLLCSARLTIQECFQRCRTQVALRHSKRSRAMERTGSMVRRESSSVMSV